MISSTRIGRTGGLRSRCVASVAPQNPAPIIATVVVLIASPFVWMVPHAPLPRRPFARRPLRIARAAASPPHCHRITTASPPHHHRITAASPPHHRRITTASPPHRHRIATASPPHRHRIATASPPHHHRITTASPRRRRRSRRSRRAVALDARPFRIQ
ncbi:hypothetical protein [Burkholderia pseudomallei]|uniref:hypothetical protein n=1 Tax=Burkholderia pseudomallei TaxID=28450 RepID=UPI00190F3CDD|nr:hypothetical protein [Burkholderia pseudomallei]